MFYRLTITLLVVFCAKTYAQQIWASCQVRLETPLPSEELELCIKNCKIAQSELQANLSLSNDTTQTPLQSEELDLCMKNCETAQNARQVNSIPFNVRLHTPLKSEELELCIKNCKTAQNELEANSNSSDAGTPLQSKLELCVRDCEAAQRALQANLSSSNVVSPAPIKSEEVELCMKRCKTSQNEPQTNLSTTPNVEPQTPLQPEVELCIKKCEALQIAPQTNSSSPDVTPEAPLKLEEPTEPSCANNCGATETIETTEAAKIVEAAPKELQAKWSPCSVSPKTPIQSENVELYVSNCTTAQPECKLHRGQSPKLIIKFKASTSARNVERLILADIYMARLKKRVQIPYGAIVDPCTTMTSDDDNAICDSKGVIKDKSYTYITEFKVLDDFPQVEGIEVRVILRAKIANQKSAKRWKSHPGPMFVCVEIHNVAVV